MKKAHAYLRVSGKGQIEGDGFPRQLAAIKAYAVAHDIKIASTYREEGVSGTTELENRPALMELLAAPNCNLVLVEKLDRLARDLMVQETILADLRKRGIELISVAEPDLCSTDPSRVLMRQIFGAIAQYEKAMIVAKLRGARTRVKARDGRCEGRKPFGDRPGEQAILDRIVAMRVGGAGFDAIASALNMDYVPTRAGKTWHGGVVRRILNR